jgi:hypothetical protein
MEWFQDVHVSFILRGGEVHDEVRWDFMYIGMQTGANGYILEFQTSRPPSPDRNLSI